MINGLAESVIRSKFEGVGINIGTSEGSELRVNDPSFYTDVLLRGSIGFGDSYIDGKWESPCIDGVVCKLLSNSTHSPTIAFIHDFKHRVFSAVTNLQTRKGARKVIDIHYNLPPSFFEVVLGPTNQYTCAYFQDANNLDEAQEKKLDVICQKLYLEEGTTLLDIGGGWGGLAEFAARKYGARPTVVTLSEEQVEFIKRNYKDLDIKVFIGDYRDIPKAFNDGEFDAVTSVGCLEHIGHKNYEKFFEIVSRVISPDGRFLLHNIYTPKKRAASDPWLRKHIFPNGELPTVRMIEQCKKYMPAINETGVEREIPPNVFGSSPCGMNFHEELTSDYAETLRAWYTNLVKGRQEKAITLNDREFRTWEYYFLSCRGAFQAKSMRVGQSIFLGPRYKEQDYSCDPFAPAFRLMELSNRNPFVFDQCLREAFSALKGDNPESVRDTKEEKERRRFCTLMDSARYTAQFEALGSPSNPRYSTYNSLELLAINLGRLFFEHIGRFHQKDPGEFVQEKEYQKGLVHLE
jgi:cyclopropane-fatty-acyl-phospholipid synthase